MSISRRGFLCGTAGAAAVALSGSLVRAGGMPAGGRCLVMIELAGGNDALNTVIPIRQRSYYTLRPTLAIRANDALPLDGMVALHPAMAGMHEVYQRGQLAIIQGVGYPGFSRSHHRAMEIWHRGDLDPSANAGWLAAAPAAELCYVGEEAPPAYEGASGAPVRIDAATFEEALVAVAGRVAGSSTRQVHHVILPGFDTHVGQAQPHGALLGRLSAGVSRFLDDVRSAGRQQDVVVMIFSEFGRRLRENSSGGTDHGTAGVVFAAGGAVRGGIYGDQQVLSDLVDGDMVHAVDFRACYAQVLRRWVGVPATGWGEGVRFLA